METWQASTDSRLGQIATPVSRFSQGPDTRHLVFQVALFRWFETQTFKLFTCIGEFYATRQVDKTRQETGS